MKEKTHDKKKEKVIGYMIKLSKESAKCINEVGAKQSHKNGIDKIYITQCDGERGCIPHKGNHCC